MCRAQAEEGGVQAWGVQGYRYRGSGAGKCTRGAGTGLVGQGRHLVARRRDKLYCYLPLTLQLSLATLCPAQQELEGQLGHQLGAVPERRRATRCSSAAATAGEAGVFV